MATATSRFLPTREVAARPSQPQRSALRHRLTYLGGAAYLLLLILLATTGPAGAVLALLGAIGPLVLMVLGAERLGMSLLVLAYFVATFGAKGQEGSPILIVDVLLLLAWLLLLPRVLAGSSRFAPPMATGLALILVTGLFASAFMSTYPAGSLRTLASLIYIMLVIPLAMATLHPSRRMIHIFAWSFIIGQVINTLYSVARNPTTGIRHMGLTHHPNAFAEAGLLSFALLLALLPVTRRRRLVFAAMGICLLAVYLSGSRAALLGAIVIILATPFVERNAPAGAIATTVIIIGTLGLIALVDRVSSNSALGRLVGANGTADASDSVREDALSDGFQMFQAHPLGGNGLHNVALVHNFAVEIAVGCGVFGLLGYLLLVWAIGRPLLGSSPHRRWAYPVLAFLVFSSTSPSLEDRTAWLVLALSIAIFRGYPEPPGDFDDDTAVAETPGPSPNIRAMSGRVTR